MACGCGDSSSWTCPRPSARRSPRTSKARRRKDSRSVSRQGRGSRERVRDEPTHRDKRRRGRAKSAREYRRYTGDRRSPSLPGRITLDTRVILAQSPRAYAETITRISLVLSELAPARPFSAAHLSVTALQLAAAAEPSAYVAARAASVVRGISAPHERATSRSAPKIGHGRSQKRTNLIRVDSRDQAS